MASPALVRVEADIDSKSEGGVSMLKEYLGDNYHDSIRELLKADDYLLPDSIIDAELNVGATKIIIDGMLESCVQINSERRKERVSRAVKLTHCAVLCTMLKSRTKNKMFANYRRDWEYKRKQCMDKADKIMFKLLK
ncbi:MAG: hypothetical protein WCS17_12900 [Prevotella sp.]